MKTTLIIRALTVGALLCCLGIPAGANASQGKLRKQLMSKLDQYGVGYVAIRTFGADCVDCVGADDDWEALRNEYASVGLRVLTIVQPAESGECSIPEAGSDWSVCDSNSEIFSALGLLRPAGAFLWSWTGRMLVNNGELKAVESLVEQSEESKLMVVLETSVQRSAKPRKLDEAARKVIEGGNKFRLLSADATKDKLNEIEQRWMNSMLSGKSTSCVVGSSENPFHVLRLSFLGMRSKKRTSGALLSGNANCTLSRVKLKSQVKMSDTEKLKEQIQKAYEVIVSRIELPIELPKTLKVASAAEGLPEMVQVPSGPVFYGCDDAVDFTCMRHESPSRTVAVEAFEIDRTEVTVEAYASCIAGGGCERNGAVSMAASCNWGREDRLDHPMNCVNWNEANAYCAWRGKRLPYEAEWEKAARGGDGDRRLYPWGNDTPSCKTAVMHDKEEGGDGCGNGRSTYPVGSKPNGVSPYGVLDALGNVSEWVDSWYAPGYYDSPDWRVEGPATGSMKVFRGGGYYHRVTDMRISYRDRQFPYMRNGALGFRCARGLD